MRTNIAELQAGARKDLPLQSDIPLMTAGSRLVRVEVVNRSCASGYAGNRVDIEHVLAVYAGDDRGHRTQQVSREPVRALLSGVLIVRERRRCRHNRPRLTSD